MPAGLNWHFGTGTGLLILSLMYLERSIFSQLSTSRIVFQERSKGTIINRSSTIDQANIILMGKKKTKR